MEDVRFSRVLQIVHIHVYHHTSCKAERDCDVIVPDAARSNHNVADVFVAQILFRLLTVEVLKERVLDCPLEFSLFLLAYSCLHDFTTEGMVIQEVIANKLHQIRVILVNRLRECVQFDLKALWNNSRDSATKKHSMKLKVATIHFRPVDLLAELDAREVFLREREATFVDGADDARVQTTEDAIGEDFKDLCRHHLTKTIGFACDLLE